ncbi:hypothetical protein FIBSPDRAFT_1037358 [Athelia psychrophila]|uniref:DUF6534 domain-containing protein n=1 Tax=Athelia psychrophila TaxID=1759441 RepID=A0A166ULE0_9AGAM|nr:hypothetical protein FIBSPDRAFT_1037358 [Fibularhizoctonia sp. CBS 109695]
MLNPAKNALGPIFWGTAIAGALYGVLVMQVIMYFRQRGGAKRPFVKYVVGGLFFTNTTQTILAFVYLYRTLVQRSGDVSAVEVADWTFMLGKPAFTAVIAGTVQLFYAWRVHVLIKKLYFTLAIVIGALTGTVLGISLTVGDARIPQFNRWHKELAHNLIAWLGVSACTDIIFATLLVTFLSKRRTGLAVTDSVINRMIRDTLQTGLLTAVVAIMNLVMFVAATNRSSLILNVPLSKVYNISFMSLLLHYGIHRPSVRLTPLRCIFQNLPLVYLSHYKINN